MTKRLAWLLSVGSLVLGIAMVARLYRSKNTDDAESAAKQHALTMVTPAHFDALIDEYGESIPDAYHPPLPSRSPDSMAPDPELLAQSRIEFAAALDRHGYKEKATRVRALVPK